MFLVQFQLNSAVQSFRHSFLISSALGIELFSLFLVLLRTRFISIAFKVTYFYVLFLAFYRQNKFILFGLFFEAQYYYLSTEQVK